MLCSSCRRQLARGARTCGACGAPVGAARDPLHLVLADGTHVPVAGAMTLGRAATCTVRLMDPAVSRLHARIDAGPGLGEPTVQDAGSRYGTLLDGEPLHGPRPLRDGARLLLGDQELHVERPRHAWEAGRTIVVGPGTSVVVPAAGPAVVEGAASRAGPHPRLADGTALKRLPADEGPLRWVLGRRDGGPYVRLGDDEAALARMLDGRDLVDVVREAERRIPGDAGARVATLICELAERGFLAGAPAALPTAPSPSALRRLTRSRERAWPGAGDAAETAYRRGGWLLFTRPAIALTALLAVLGIGCFAALVAGRYGTPFVVADHLGLGGLVFVAGRIVLVGLHEAAHALTMASFGRRVQRAGVKLVLVFPYAFVDVSEAWFEPRRRRIAVCAAGPWSDAALGGAFAIACLAMPAATPRDVVFQLAFAAYVGACVNLNPLVDRDGYQVLADVLREPTLRERARAAIEARLSGDRGHRADRAVRWYGVAGLAWLAVAAGAAIALSLRYAPMLRAHVPPPVVWAALGAAWLAAWVPFGVALARPLRARRRAA